MRIRLALAIVFAFYIGIACKPALANTITYTAPTKDEPGKFSGDIPLTKIGPILLPDGSVQFVDDELNIGAVPDWLFDRDIVLKGAIVRAELVPQQNLSLLGGLVFFYDGQWLPNLGSLRAPDIIDTISGEHIQGRIIGRAGQAFVVKPEAGASRKVSFTDIKTISSPRAFSFTITAPTTRLVPADTSLTFDATLIKLTPTALNGHLLASRKATLPRSNLPGADPGVSNQTIATFVAIDIASDIIPAVSIPLVLNRSTQSAALNQIHRFLVNEETPGPGTPYIP
jgi:hypothetical protein